MQWASRQLTRLLSHNARGLAPRRVGGAPAASCRVSQCHARRAMSSAASPSSYLRSDAASFEMEGELEELRQEAERVAQRWQQQQQRQQEQQRQQTEWTDEKSQNPATPSPPTVITAEPVCTPRWTTRHGRRLLFVGGSPLYARQSITYLHAVAHLPFPSLVAQLARSHPDALLVMLEYIARCRSEATALVGNKTQWCTVERACWTALCVLEPQAPQEGCAHSDRALTSKHLSHLAQRVSNALPASTGPAALPFLLLCYRHRRQLRRLQAVQVLEALMRVPPPDSFAFSASDALAEDAKALYASVLSHLVWRCVTMNDKDFVDVRRGHSAPAQRTSPPHAPGTLVGGFDVVQTVEHALLWRAHDLPAVLQHAAAIWVQKHTPHARAPKTTDPSRTFLAVVRDPILGPRPFDAAAREEKKHIAADVFAKLKQTVRNTNEFAVPGVEVGADARGASFLAALTSEMALTPTLARVRTTATTASAESAPMTVPSQGDAGYMARHSRATDTEKRTHLLLHGEDSACVELRTLLTLLPESGGTARRDMLAAAHALILQLTAPTYLVTLLESDALLRGDSGAAVLRGPLVLQCLRAVPYMEVECGGEKIDRLTAALMPMLHRGGALAVLRAAVHTLPHWHGLSRQRSAAQRVAREQAFVSRLVHLAPLSLIPVFLSQLAQDGELAAFRPAPLVAQLTVQLVRRAAAVQSDAETLRPETSIRLDSAGDPLASAVRRLAQQEAQQAPLALPSDAPVASLTSLPSSPLAEVSTAACDAYREKGVTLDALIASACAAPRVSAAEQERIAQGWRQLNRLAQLTLSLAEEVALWQCVSQGHFHRSPVHYEMVQRTENDAALDTDAAALFASRWPGSQRYTQALLHRVNGRLLLRVAGALMHIATDAAGEAPSPMTRVLSDINGRLREVEQRLATTSQPWATLLFTYSVLLACGRRPVLVTTEWRNVEAPCPSEDQAHTQSSHSQDRDAHQTWTLAACPPRTSADTESDGSQRSADLTVLARALRSGQGAHTVSTHLTLTNDVEAGDVRTLLILLQTMPAVRASFAALKDAAVTTRRPPRTSAAVLRCAAQAHLWCTLATLYVVARAAAVPHTALAPAHVTSILPLLYRDALTTVLHLVEHDSHKEVDEQKSTEQGVSDQGVPHPRTPVLSLDKALPDRVVLSDIFTVALHEEVFDVARRQMTPVQVVELCDLAASATTTVALGLPALPLPIVQNVARHCVMNGVALPANVRSVLERVKAVE